MKFRMGGPQGKLDLGGFGLGGWDGVQLLFCFYTWVSFFLSKYMGDFDSPLI